MTVSPHLDLDQSCYCTPLYAQHINYKPAINQISNAGNHTHLKTDKTSSAHLPYVVQWHSVPWDVLANMSKQMWGCLQSNLTGFFWLHCIRFGVQHLISWLAWAVSSEKEGLKVTDTWETQGITGGGSKEELPATKAATAMEKGHKAVYSPVASFYGASVCGITQRCSISWEPEVWERSFSCRFDYPDCIRSSRPA